MTSLSQEERDYLTGLLAEQTPRPKRRRMGCADVLFLGILTAMLIFALAVKGPELLVTYGLVSVETMTRVLNVEAAPTVGTIVPTPAQPPQNLRQPVVQPPAPLPSCETVTDTRTACVQASTDRSVDSPTPTAAPTPTATADTGSFWTPAEQTAIAATEQAWYDPATLPTAPPAFVEAVQEGCNDPAKLEQSALLRTFCAPLDD